MNADFLVKVHDILSVQLDERTRRLLAAAQAMALGRGGISTVARETGIARGYIRLSVRFGITFTVFARICA